MYAAEFHMPVHTRHSHASIFSNNKSRQKCYLYDSVNIRLSFQDD